MFGMTEASVEGPDHWLYSLFYEDGARDGTKHVLYFNLQIHLYVQVCVCVCVPMFVW